MMRQVDRYTAACRRKGVLRREYGYTNDALNGLSPEQLSDLLDLERKRCLCSIIQYNYSEQYDPKEKSKIELIRILDKRKYFGRNKPIILQNPKCKYNKKPIQIPESARSLILDNYRKFVANNWNYKQIEDFLAANGATNRVGKPPSRTSVRNYMELAKIELMQTGVLK